MTVFDFNKDKKDETVSYHFNGRHLADVVIKGWTYDIPERRTYDIVGKDFTRKSVPATELKRKYPHAV
jgi:hypothetical protein|tara:strand:- start:275 stop:478 length:204 start_codon:yes stop_codon:yes gene_type:complete